MVAHIGVGAAFLGADEVLELHRVAHEEHRRVVPHHVVVALTGVELQRETPRVAPSIGTAALAGDGRKTHQHVRLGAPTLLARLKLNAGDFFALIYFQTLDAPAFPEAADHDQ